MTDSVTQEVFGLLRDERNNRFARCESPSLRLEKFVHIGDNSKKDEIEAVVDCHKTHAKPIPLLEPRGAVPFVAKPRNRLIVNQAGGILENAGICLHTHFGAPYIPGSAVKGIARHAAWCAWNEEKDEEEKKKIALRIAQVFGYPTGDSRPKKNEEVTRDGPDAYLDDYLAARGWKDKSSSGVVAFLPAVPCTEKAVSDKGKLDVDIVNVHQRAYYGSRSREASPSSKDQPNPQFFPTVKNGVCFRFTIAPVRRGGESLLSSAKDWLWKALEENGAGAKTAAGYGWFDLSDAREEERKRAEKERIERLSSQIPEYRSKLQPFASADYLSADQREQLTVLFSEINAENVPVSKLDPEYAKAKSIFDTSVQVDAMRKSFQGSSARPQPVPPTERGLPPIPDRYESADAFVLTEILPFADPACSEQRRKETVGKIVAAIEADCVRTGWSLVKDRDRERIAVIRRADGSPIARKEKRGIEVSVGKIREWAKQHNVELP